MQPVAPPYTDHPDNVAVDAFAKEMKIKLARSRALLALWRAGAIQITPNTMTTTTVVMVPPPVYERCIQLAEEARNGQGA